MHRRNRRLLRFARAMRSDPTPAEEILWRRLRGGELGVRFRRQELIGGHIVDFVCKSRRVVVETDGDSHTDLGKDMKRDRRVADAGYLVIHFSDSEVYENLDGVLDCIWEQVHWGEDDEE